MIMLVGIEDIVVELSTLMGDVSTFFILLLVLLLVVAFLPSIFGFSSSTMTQIGGFLSSLPSFPHFSSFIVRGTLMNNTTDGLNHE